MKRRLIELTAFLLVVGFLGVIVVASGVVPVKASSGHWPITRALLSFAMRRSVETHAARIEVPDLSDDGLVLRGAGQYDRACQPCHGAPGERPSVVLQELTPVPPYLPDAITLWEPAELFEIVKHGVKMTGMPAWPALQRDDEVWAMVAFLTLLPDMEAEKYRELAWGAASDTAEALGAERMAGVPAQVAATCAQCHGPHGLGRGEGAFPRIAGQSAAYLAATIEAYADADRHSGLMQPVSAALDTGTIAALARHYAAATPDGGAHQDDGTHPDSALLARGKEIAVRGIPERKIPTCTECHGPGVGPRNPFYPALAGQYADYLELQLRLFREERRGGTVYAKIMSKVVHALEEDDARAVALWYASLAWGGSAGPPRSPE